jgi:hypothetical protein
MTFTDKLGRHSVVKTDAFIPGEEGLWSLTGSDGKLIVVPDKTLPFIGSARKRFHHRYAELLAVANAARVAFEVPPERRSEVLSEYAFSCTPEVSAWAVSAIDATGEKATNVLDRLADRADLPAAGQVVLDEALCRRKGDDWAGSDTRDRLLQSWVTGKSNQHDATLVLARLDLSAQLGELPHDRASELTRIAAENKGWPREARLEAVRRVGLVGVRAINDDPAFNWLILQVRTHPDPDYRRKAAGAITWFPLYPARLKAVTEQLMAEKDQEVAALLTKASRNEEKRK